MNSSNAPQNNLMSGEEIIDIREFDMRGVEKSATWIFIGPPSSGKTFLMKFMVYAFKHIYPVGEATCGTEGSQQAFTPIFTPLFVSNEYSNEDQVMHAKRQKLCIAENSYPYAISILDDCSDDTKIYSSTIIRASFKNGRQHWKRQFWVGLQYGLDMKPEIRKMVTYVVLFREPEENEREKLYKNFGGICGSRKVFDQLMDQFTGEKGECLIFYKGSTSNKIQDCVFWFKAPAWKWNNGSVNPYPEGWKFGCNEFRKWYKERYNTNYVDPIV